MIAATAHSAGDALQFSAEAVQEAPGQPPQTARMFVGDGAVRTEYTRDGEPVAEIAYRDSGRRLLLLPRKGAYREYVPEMPPPPKQTTLDPCAGLTAKSVECKRLGEETVKGRDTVKWEIVTQRDHTTLRSLHWVDKERGIPIREFLPDGTVLELEKLGDEHLNGRAVEKWKMTASHPDGRMVNSFQWYDPVLGIAIREEREGGYVRELRSIQIGAQPAHLFQLPDGLRKEEPPPPSRVPSQSIPRQGTPPGYPGQQRR